MEVRESVCTDQFITFDSLVSSMLSEIGDAMFKLRGCQGWVLTSTLPERRSRNPNHTS